MTSDYVGWYINSNDMAICPDCGGEVYHGDDLDKLLDDIDKHICGEECASGVNG